jgi:hypothetical protein
LNKSATDALIPTATQADAVIQPLDIISRSNDDDATNFRGLTTTTIQGAAYIGREIFRISTPGNAASYYSVSMDFEDVFKFTALSLDKNIYNPANMVLQIYFNAGDSFLFNCAANNDATTPVSSPAGTVSNLQVQLANEANLNLVAQTIDLVMKQGVTLPVAYPTVTRQAFSTTTAPSYQLQLTSGYGKRILFLASSPFGLAGTGINANNYHGIFAANGTTQVLTQYQTTLNSVPIKTPAGFNVLKGEDYNVGNKSYLVNSPTQSLGYYRYYDWVHIDSFFGERPLSSLDQTLVDGIDVSTQSQTFGFQATTTSLAQTWVTAIVGQKMLQLTSGGAIMT